MYVQFVHNVEMMKSWRPPVIHIFIIAVSTFHSALQINMRQSQSSQSLSCKGRRGNRFSRCSLRFVQPFQLFFLSLFVDSRLMDIISGDRREFSKETGIARSLDGESDTEFKIIRILISTHEDFQFISFPSFAISFFFIIKSKFLYVV